MSNVRLSIGKRSNHFLRGRRGHIRDMASGLGRQLEAEDKAVMLANFTSLAVVVGDTHENGHKGLREELQDVFTI